MDFDIEDGGSFYNWDGPGVDWSSVPSIDISGVGSIPEYDFSFLDDLIPSGVNSSSFDTSFLDDFDFASLLGIGDQPGDFPLEGNYGNPLAPGLKDLVDDLLARNVLNDPFSTYDSPKDFPIEGGYGNPLAPGVKEAVDELLKYNADYATGGGQGTKTDTSAGGGGGGNFLKSILDAIKKNPALAAALLGGLGGLLGRPKDTVSRVGYQGGGGGVSTASRQALSPAGAPGSGGRRFMTDVRYAADGGLMSVMPGQPNESVIFMNKGGKTKAEEDLETFLEEGKDADVDTVNKADFLMKRGIDPKNAFKGAPQIEDTAKLAKGGISDLGSFTHAKGGRMLKGPGDGMSDSIPATIEGVRPARLANDEFVVPADVVSHLGNGSSDAGAKVLYEMMAKVRKARTGKTKQGKQIDPSKYLPK